MNKYKTWAGIWLIFGIGAMYHDTDIFAVCGLICSTIWVATGWLVEDLK